MMKKILVIAPHRDDEILGCGGTIIKHIESGNQVYICFVTKGLESMFSKSLIQSGIDEANECHKYIGITKTFNLDFPAALLDSVEKYRINAALVKVVNEVCPDIVYIPHYGDMHTDHQIVADAAMVALRPNGQHRVCEIYSYETLSETEWNYPEQHIVFIPTVYSDITKQFEKKINAMQYYKSQLYEYPHPRSLKAIEYMASYRGSQVLIEKCECFRLIRALI